MTNVSPSPGKAGKLVNRAVGITIIRSIRVNCVLRGDLLRAQTRLLPPLLLFPRHFRRPVSPRPRFHQSSEFCARFAHYSNPCPPFSSPTLPLISRRLQPPRKIESSISRLELALRVCLAFFFFYLLSTLVIFSLREAAGTQVY